MPPEFTVLLGDLLRYTKYAIKIANGLSKVTYIHSKKLPNIYLDKVVQYKLLDGANSFQ